MAQRDKSAALASVLVGRNGRRPKRLRASPVGTECAVVSVNRNRISAARCSNVDSFPHLPTPEESCHARHLWIVGSGCLVACASLAFAQNRDPELPARPATGARPAIATTTQAWTADQQIAACLHNCCRNEVEISKFALERLESNEARQFAEQMIAEHTAACEKLAKFAGGAVSVDTRLETVPGAARREERRDEREERR
jgi:predicted outer membrane protein